MSLRIIPVGDIRVSEPDAVTGLVSLVILTGAAHVRQKLQVRFKFFLGEWFLDQRLGVPYYRDVLGMNPNLDVVRSIFRSVILSVAEVASVDKLTLAHNEQARTLAIEFDASLVEGGVLQVRQPDPPFIIQVQRAA